MEELKNERYLVILPVYNEAKNVPQLVKEILDIDKNLKILLVDDNSTDNSLEVTIQLSKENPQRIYYFRRDGQRGRGISIRQGYRFAISKGFNYVIEMDADFSHNPKYIPQLLQEAENKNVDIVIGSRYARGGKIKGHNIIRSTLSYLANIYLRYILNLMYIKDITSGFRCININFLRKINLNYLNSKGPEALQEIIFKNRTDLSIKEIPIIFEKRRYGKSKLSVSMLLKCLIAPWKWRK
jgi:dolichol-phosphate mannosyltransferase